MLAKLGVVLLELHPLGGVPAVLRRRIARCPGSLGAFEDHLDACVLAFSHRYSGSDREEVVSDADAVGARVFEHGADSLLVDGFQRLRGYPKRDPAVLFRNVEALLLKVHVEPAPHLVMSVRDVVAGHRPLAGKLIFACHRR